MTSIIHGLNIFRRKKNIVEALAFAGLRVRSVLPDGLKRVFDTEGDAELFAEWCRIRHSDFHDVSVSEFLTTPIDAIASGPEGGRF
jgi:hypothetical protein